MTLVPYDNPFRQLEGLRQNMNNLFNEGFFNYAQSLQNPRIDIYDSGNEVIASCEIPGLEKKDDVRIEIRDDVLTISGTIKRSKR
jgi:HSP20 family protein